MPNFIEAPSGYAAAIEEWWAAQTRGNAFSKVNLEAGGRLPDSIASWTLAEDAPHDGGTTRATKTHKLSEKGGSKLDLVSRVRDGALVLLRGTSPRGDHGHVVVGRVVVGGGGEAGAVVVPVHDPHPDGTMLRPPLVWAGLFDAIARSRFC